MARDGNEDHEFQRLMMELQERILEEQRKTYSETVIREASNPRNAGRIEYADAYAKRQGSCGETIEIWLRIDNDSIREARFMTDGCGPSVACGSMLTALVAGKPIDDIEDISPDDLLAALGGLPEESIHCAHLAVNTLRAAIDQWWEESQKETGGT
jgi:nitrogen fixation NifU-like protein